MPIDLPLSIFDRQSSRSPIYRYIVLVGSASKGARETNVSRYLRQRTFQNASPFRQIRFASYANNYLKVEIFC